MMSNKHVVKVTILLDREYPDFSKISDIVTIPGEAGVQEANSRCITVCCLNKGSAERVVQLLALNGFGTLDSGLDRDQNVVLFVRKE